MTFTMRRISREWSENAPSERPTTEVVARIQALVTDIRETEESLAILNTRLEHTVSCVKQGVQDEQQLADAVSYIYWRFPEVSSISLARAVMETPSAKVLRKYLHTVDSGIRCLRCGERLQFSTREELHDALAASLRAEGGDLSRQHQLRCAKCAKEGQNEIEAKGNQLFAEWRAQHEAEETAKQQRVSQLRRMPYREYLETPDWRERRRRHLLSAGNACQVCNATGVELHVHHRTYERLGEERYQDLIVLCRQCHQVFHDNRRIT